ncbi:hypothetical protein EV363DRAFT_1188775, partial [Boletus edulis]
AAWSHSAEFSDAHMPRSSLGFNGRTCSSARGILTGRRSSSQETKDGLVNISMYLPPIGELRLYHQCLFFPVRSLSAPKLSFLLTFFQVTYALSNKDLNPSDPNRAGAFLLRSPPTCPDTTSTCARLQETLLPPPTSTRADLTSENLTAVLASDRRNCQSLSLPCAI